MRTLSAGDRETPAGSSNDPYPAILDSYLSGNLHETVVSLRRHLARFPRDVDARMLLATALRRLKKFDEAEAELGKLSDCDYSRKWVLEILRESQLIKRAMEASEEPIVRAESP